MTAQPSAQEPAQSLPTAEPVAWLWWDANASGIDSTGKRGRYKVSDLDPPDIRAFPVYTSPLPQPPTAQPEAREALIAAAEEMLCALEDDHPSEVGHCSICIARVKLRAALSKGAAK